MTQSPKDDELLETLFGLIAVRKGFVTADDHVKALEIQVLEELEFGVHRKVGEILLDQKVMATGQMGEVLNDLSPRGADLGDP